MATSTPNKLPRPSALKQYAEAGWQFVPLHHWAEKRQLPPTAKNPQGRLLELGKAPVGKAWTKHGVDLKKATTHANAGKNVGAMIPPGWAVIDVDPRNFKGEDNSWDRLQADIGFDLSKYAAVKTGSGGWHVFVRIPLDYKGVVKIEAYPGIEFKQIGVQVVAAGSIHPKTQDYYVWMDAAVSLADTGEAPAKLLELYKVTRPLISGSDGGDTWGSLTVEQIEEGLGLLDTTLFKEQDYWFGLMCSVHWLSGGEARQQFIEWSAQDNEFADQMDTVAARWDSLGRGSASAQLVARGGQFFKALKTHAGVEPHDSRFGLTVERSFSDLGMDEVNEDLKLIGAKNERVREEAYQSAEAIVDAMNEKHFVLNYRGKTVIGTKRRIDEKGGAYDRYEFQDAASFKLFYSNQKMPDGVSYGEYWLAAKHRRTYDGFDFRPDEPPGAYRTMSGELMLNQWTGFAIQPRAGDWSMFNDLILNVICRGDRVKYEFLLNWCAHSYQKLSGPIGVAVALKGRKGTGKTSFWKVWSRPFGTTHSMTTAKMESVFGNHNGRMHAKIAVGLEEAYFAGSKMAEAQLKDLITGDTFGINEKFLPEYAQTNHTKLVVLTNDDWAVPATEDERRYFVTETSDGRKDDHEFWTAFNEQMYEKGGCEAFFHDMLKRDITGFNPYRDVPRTEELLGQIEITRGPLIDWIQERMTFGEHGFGYAWNNSKGWVVPRSEFWEDFKTWQINSPRGRYDSSIRSQNQFTRELKRVIPEELFKNSTATPPPEYQSHVKTYPATINGTTYHLSNVFLFPSFDALRNTISSKYGIHFQEIDVSDLEAFDPSELTLDADEWDIL